MWNFQTNLSKHTHRYLKTKTSKHDTQKTKKTYISLLFLKNNSKKKLSKSIPQSPVRSDLSVPKLFDQLSTASGSFGPRHGSQASEVTLHTGSGGGLGGGLVWLQTRWKLGAQVGVFGLIRWKTTTLRLICNIQSWWNSSFDQSFWLSQWKWCGFFCGRNTWRCQIFNQKKVGTTSRNRFSTWNCEPQKR